MALIGTLIDRLLKRGSITVIMPTAAKPHYGPAAARRSPAASPIARSCSKCSHPRWAWAKPIWTSG